MTGPEQVATESVTVTQHWLGMSPYVLIEVRAATDGSGEPALFVDAGGGAEEEPTVLPLLSVTERPPEGNPLAEMLRRVYRDTGPSSTGSGTVETIVREINEDWLPFVTDEG